VREIEEGDMAIPGETKQTGEWAGSNNAAEPDVESSANVAFTSSAPEELIPHEGTLLPPAGLVKRVGAFAIDAIILGIIGVVIGFIFGGPLSSLGPYARLIGAAIALAYYSYYNSRLGNGQTPGKKVLNLVVVNKNGQTISLPRAFLRSVFLVIIFLFSGWNLPILSQVTWLEILKAIIVYGLGGAVAYLLLFNRPARQGVHDLVAGTYVVFKRGTLIEVYPATPRNHKLTAVIIAVFLSVVMWGAVQALSARLIPATSTQKFQPLLQVLARDQRFIAVEISEEYWQAVGRQQEILLTVTLILRNDPGDAARMRIAQDVAQLAATHLATGEYDSTAVQMASGYDLGFANSSTTWTYYPPKDWSLKTTQFLFMKMEFEQ